MCRPACAWAPTPSRGYTVPQPIWGHRVLGREASHHPSPSRHLALDRSGNSLWHSRHPAQVSCYGTGWKLP